MGRLCLVVELAQGGPSTNGATLSSYLMLVLCAAVVQLHQAIIKPQTTGTGMVMNKSEIAMQYVDSVCSG